jgi:hypothetical protein
MKYLLPLFIAFIFRLKVSVKVFSEEKALSGCREDAFGISSGNGYEDASFVDTRRAGS